MVEVRSARLRRTRRRGLTIVEATVADASGSIGATWFNQPWLADRLRPGVAMLLVGTLDRRGFRVSEHEFLGGGGRRRAAHPASTPPAWSRSTRRPRGCARSGSGSGSGRRWRGSGDVIEPLPAELRGRRGLRRRGRQPPRGALSRHAPSEAEEARRRIAFEELFLYQARPGRAPARSQDGGARDGGSALPGPLIERWLASLPFEPTDDQRKAFAELDRDLDSGEPMQRLLMGEVGSGKTVVALYAMLRALEAGFQAALMAPTETLAEQHAATLDRLLGGGGDHLRPAHRVDPRRRAAAMPRPGSPPASSVWWWGRTR